MFEKIKKLLGLDSKEIPVEDLKAMGIDVFEPDYFDLDDEEDEFRPEDYIQDPERLEAFRNMPEGQLKESAIRFLQAGGDPDEALLTIEDIDGYFLGE